MKIELYTEICCDYCNDVIHNHIDCPACKEEYAGTDAYYDIWEEVIDEGFVEITCESCKAKFKTVNVKDEDGGIAWRDDWEWEQV